MPIGEPQFLVMANPLERGLPRVALSAVSGVWSLCAGLCGWW